MANKVLACKKRSTDSSHAFLCLQLLIRLSVHRIYWQLERYLWEKAKNSEGVSKPSLITCRKESVRVIINQMIPMTENARASFDSSIGGLGL